MRLPLGLAGRRRIGWVFAVAGGALMLSPIAAARSHHAGAQATTAAAAGTVYGGLTTQHFPVVIETSKNGRTVVHANIGIRMTCTSGQTASTPDNYDRLSVNGRKFSASFGPVTNRNDDGTTTDLEGAMRGTFNKARTKVSGTWSFKATDHDTGGAITDICSAGVSWTAKQ